MAPAQGWHAQIEKWSKFFCGFFSVSALLLACFNGSLSHLGSLEAKVFFNVLDSVLSAIYRQNLGIDFYRDGLSVLSAVYVEKSLLVVAAPLIAQGEHNVENLFWNKETTHCVCSLLVSWLSCKLAGVFLQIIAVFFTLGFSDLFLHSTVSNLIFCWSTHFVMLFYFSGGEDAHCLWRPYNM